MTEFDPDDPRLDEEVSRRCWYAIEHMGDGASWSYGNLLVTNEFADARARLMVGFTTDKQSTIIYTEEGGKGKMSYRNFDYYPQLLTVLRQQQVLDDIAQI